MMSGLTELQNSILKAVEARGERGIGRDYLIREVYGDDGCSPSTIRSHIFNINARLRAKGREVRARGNGALRYRLVKREASCAMP
jgi:DNA-binding winged helix-turn-helix (wHTH) protein